MTEEMNKINEFMNHVLSGNANDQKKKTPFPTFVQFSGFYYFTYVVPKIQQK